MKAQVQTEQTKTLEHDGEVIYGIFGNEDEAIGFLDGRIVHLKEEKLIPLTLAESVKAVIELREQSRRFRLDECTEDEPSVILWLKMVAEAGVPACVPEQHREIICEYTDGPDWQEGIAFEDGGIVHYLNGKEKRMNLRQSVVAFKKMELGRTTDGTHDTLARAKWLQMVANCLR